MLNRKHWPQAKSFFGVIVVVMMTLVAITQNLPADPPKVSSAPKTATRATTGGDLEFERLINVPRLQSAWHDLDAAQLTDVVVDFAVAERVIGRPHKTIAIHDLLDTAMRLAIENGDRETLKRIEAIAVARQDASLISQLKLAAPSRSAGTSDWFTATKDLTPEIFEVYVQVQNLMKTAQVAGDQKSIEQAVDVVSKSKFLTAAQQKDLRAKIARYREETPDEVNPASVAIKQLAGPSRAGGHQETLAAWNRLSLEEKQKVIQAGLNAEKLKQKYDSSSPRKKNTFNPASGSGWTLMVYLAADSNLERAIMDNLEELVRVGPAEGINVVVLADRSSRDDNEDDDLDEDDEDWKPENRKRYTNREVADAGNWTGAKIFRIEKDSLVLIKDLGDANTGNGQTLKSFLQLAVQQFPANHYGLIVSGHGAAWEEVCPDSTAADSDEKASLTMMEVRDAIDQGVGQPLDLLAFDCCLMANFEVFNTLAKSTRAIAASEELAPGAGWNYAALMRTLSKNPDISGLDVGVTMGEAFVDYFAKLDAEEYDESTFSVIDMEKWPAIDQALNQLSRGLGFFLTKDMDGSWLKIARAASEATEFDSGEGGLLDLNGFSKHLIQQFDHPQLKADAERLNQAIKAAVAFNHCGRRLPDSNGISIYLPHRKVEIEVDDGEKEIVDWAEKFNRYALLPLAVNKHAWFPFIEQASKLAQLKRMGELLGELEAQTDDDVTELTIPVLDHENLDEALFLLAMKDGDKLISLGQSPLCPYLQLNVANKNNSEQPLSASWDGNWFVFMDGDQKLGAPWVDGWEDEEDGETIYFRRATVEIATSKSAWSEATLFFKSDDEDSEEWEFDHGFINDDDAKTPIELTRGMRLRTFVKVMDANGTETKIPVKDNVMKLTKPKQFSLSMQLVPAGEYQVGFTATDLNGNVVHKTVSVKQQ
jgi:hypothetical protein